jgi:hypothetical protein
MRLTRRRWLSLTAMSGLSFLVSSRDAAFANSPMTPFLNRSRKLPQTLGTTFSQLQCQYMGLDYQETFRQVCALGFRRIRLGSYWNEIEAVENSFDFTKLDWLLEESQRQGIEIVLTVGMKAPRYPEYHFPQWLEARYDTRDRTQPLDRNPAIAEYTMRFVDRVMQHTHKVPHIKYWQVENEPFAKMEITGERSLSPGFVRKEIEQVRSYLAPGQKILLTNAISLPDTQQEDDAAFQVSLELADAVGINVYTKVPISDTYYLEPQPAYWKKLSDWRRALIQQGKEAWIAEAQAEPWEPKQLVAMGDKIYPSSSPQQMTLIVGRLSDMGYRNVLLWGCEYWYWHQVNGRSHWWQAVQGLMAS